MGSSWRDHRRAAPSPSPGTASSAPRRRCGGHGCWTQLRGWLPALLRARLRRAWLRVLLRARCARVDAHARRRLHCALLPLLLALLLPAHDAGGRPSEERRREEGAYLPYLNCPLRPGAARPAQPLDRIASYFGEGIAFYFAWLEFYNHWLLLPAIAGALLFMGQLYYGAIDIAYAPLFSLCVAVWAILFAEAWKRRNAELAQRWGVLGWEDEEVVRPQFRGEWMQDARTGEVVRLYPAWKRRVQHAVTIPLFIALLVAVGLGMVCVFATRDQLLAQVSV
jgi:hypothetical protein